ncbi:hypothetical protein SVAN01_09313 [Stagonosporopsis vannaccii]|nr:hypothetical protein SVAN01_09313 [Stagonosporopsis vannaccii]
MVHNLRHLSIGYAANAAALPENFLLRALRNIRTLRSFTWCTWIPISARILDCLREVHPSAQLKAVAHERNDLPLDVLLITSPQLHTLDIKLNVAYMKTDTKVPHTGNRRYKGKSELNYFKSLIVKSKSLKVLYLQFGEIKHGSKAGQNQLKDSGPASYNPLTFKFDKHEMLPPLEELTLWTQFENKGNRTTPWKAWRTHQDWTALRKLDLKHNLSREMIRSLVGVVPRLATLIMNVDDTAPYHETLSAYEEFLLTVPELASLSVSNTGDWPDGMLSIIFRTVSSQLTCLEMEIGWCLSMWRRAEFEKLLNHCVKLEQLRLQGSDRSERTQADWTTAEAKLSANEKMEHLLQYSADLCSREMEYIHQSSGVRGQRSKGAHFLSRRYHVTSSRPRWLDNTAENS